MARIAGEQCTRRGFCMERSPGNRPVSALLDVSMRLFDGARRRVFAFTTTERLGRSRRGFLNPARLRLSGYEQASVKPDSEGVQEGRAFPSRLNSLVTNCRWQPAC